MNDELRLIIKKMNNLFITERKKYITQNDNGDGYNWWESGKKKNFKKLQDYMLEYHLRGKRTYGIFSGPEVSKFVTFDVDMVSNELVLSLYKELNRIGVSSKYIHTSWSGSKGHHVDIYFSDVIHVSRVKRLFDYIKFRLKRKFPNLDIERILEFRPSPTQGVKLPLGVNLANKDPNSNVCWYVDVKDGLKPIRTLEYILNIEPINRDDLITIINTLPETVDETIEIIEEDSSSEQSPLNDHDKLTTNVTLESLELLDKNGLTQPGTRNASLCKLAIYYRAQGASKDHCKKKLITWMNAQDKRYYKTALDTCYKEIKRIVDGVYKKNIHLKQGKTEIEIFRNEILTLYYYNKFLRKTLDALFIHSKRYGDNNGEFFMTYEQLAKAAKVTPRTATTHIKSLEELRIIEVTRSPLYFDEEGPRNPPNKYKLNLNIELINDERNKSKKTTVKRPSEYGQIMTEATAKLFPNLEWARMDEILESLIINNN